MTASRTCERCGIALERLDVESVAAGPIIAGVGVAVMAIDGIWRCPRCGNGILVERLGDDSLVEHPFESAVS